MTTTRQPRPFLWIDIDQRRLDAFGRILSNCITRKRTGKKRFGGKAAMSKFSFVRTLNGVAPFAAASCVLAILYNFGITAMAGDLSSQFLGTWGVYDENATSNCAEREGITVTRKRVDWNVESVCGQIESVRPKDANNSTVVLRCVDGEGWVNGRPRPPRTYRDVQYWTLFIKNGKVLMSQTSTKDRRTDLFESCGKGIASATAVNPKGTCIGHYAGHDGQAWFSTQKGDDDPDKICNFSWQNSNPVKGYSIMRANCYSMDSCRIVVEVTMGVVSRVLSAEPFG
jgi:hypothetical protein